MNADPKSVNNAEVPAWMDAAFFQEMLRDAEDDAELVVDAVDVRFGVSKGENFGSYIHKADVTITKRGNRDHRHLMVKSLPDGEAFQKIIVESQIFQKEEKVYADLLPSFRRLQESSGTPVTPLGCVYYRTARPHTVAMEDLSIRGYRVADRRERLDLQHCLLVMRSLARFHGLSLGALQEDPSLKVAFPDTFLPPEKRAENHHFQDGNVVVLAKVIETWKGFEEYGDRLRASNVLDKVIDQLAVETKFSVLCHGDCWLNNMMFRYSPEGEVENLLFVDFQICRYNSLTYDLQYFMHSSAQDEVRTRHWDELVAAYHEAFLDTLRSIGLDTTSTFTLRELHEELRACASIGLFTATLVLPIVVADPDDAPDFTQLDAFDPEVPNDACAPPKKSVMERAYSGARYRAAMQSMLPRFGQAGIL